MRHLPQPPASRDLSVDGSDRTAALGARVSRRILALVLLAGCAHRPQGVRPDAGACVLYVALGQAVTAVADVVATPSTILPELDLDVSGCGLHVASLDVPPIDPLVQAAVAGLRLGAAQADTCEAQAALGAAADLVAGVGPAVLDELRNPDGRVHVPAVVASACPAPVTP